MDTRTTAQDFAAAMKDLRALNIRLAEGEQIVVDAAREEAALRANVADLQARLDRLERIVASQLELRP